MPAGGQHYGVLRGLSLMQQPEGGEKMRLGPTEFSLVGGEAGGNQSVWQGEDPRTR